jgi:hypothetical protein
MQGKEEKAGSDPALHYIALQFLVGDTSLAACCEPTSLFQRLSPQDATGDASRMEADKHQSSCADHLRLATLEISGPMTRE